MKAKRMLALLLCLVMVVAILPVGAAEKEYSLLDSKYVRLLGRGEKMKNGRTFNWPNAGFEFYYDGDSVSVYVDKTTYDISAYYGSYFTVAVYDGDKYIRAGRKKLQEGWNNIYNRINRDPALATIRVVRSSEADCGALSMSKIKGDGAFRATEPKDRLIEFIGDSYTVGYANSPKLTDATYRCSLNSDNWNSYTGFVARHFNADSNVLAFSGRGISVNVNGTTEANMQQQIKLQDPYIRDYPGINLSTQKEHDFSEYQPDLVTIWLGANDFSGGAKDDVVEAGYEVILNTLRDNYPDAVILCMYLENETFRTVIENCAQKEGRGEENGFYTLCLKPFATISHGHPDIQEDERIANQVIAKIESIPNVWGNEPVVDEPIVDTPVVPAGPVDALYTNAKVLVNGKEVAFEAYNIGDSNHFKLRDLAMAFNGSEKQFGVTWDGEKSMIGLLSKTAYAPVGGELVTGDGQSKLATAYAGGILADGKEVKAQAYNINGNNYFKLRDICKLFDISVGWDGETSTITLDTAKSYTE